MFLTAQKKTNFLSLQACFQSDWSQQGFTVEISIKKFSHQNLPYCNFFSLIQSDQDIFFACYTSFFSDKIPKGN